MTFSGARRGAALLALLIAAGGRVSTAQAADDDTPVSVLIGDAVAEYDAGHFQEARALFRQAHEKSPTARTLRGIGMCSFEMRDYVEAARSLGAALRETRRPLTAEQKKHAEALLSRANTFVGRFTVKFKPESGSLFVDGHPAQLEPDGLLLLPFGRHTISLRCASCSPAEKDEDVEVSGGERKNVELVLAPAPTTPPPDTSVAGAGAAGGASGGTIISPPPGGERDANADRSHAHVWLAGGAVVAALGAGGSALWWRDQQQQLDICHKNATATHICDSESDIKTQRNAAIGVTIGLGAAAVITGVAAALLWPHASNEAPAVACLPTNNSVSCAFRF